VPAALAAFNRIFQSLTKLVKEATLPKRGGDRICPHNDMLC
jgi:hypothetical protein